MEIGGQISRARKQTSVKLLLTINGQNLAADFSIRNEDVTLTLEANSYHAQLSEPEPGFFTVILANKVYLCALEKQPTGATEVIVNGQRFPVALQDPKRLSQNAGAAGQAGGRATLISPMPGKVVRVLQAVGAEVAEGQGILVVEAMKMQNEVQSPRAGKVAAINVTEGQTVNAGEMLATIE
jgi:biotin carboxyl carrier protein